MLELKNIIKDYPAGNGTVHALRDVSLSFRHNEFVSILGPSGCGKTTLLNLIGGLDHATDGDLVINGRSTREYNDRDWDTYRNHSVGFVFQSYNLIPHQTILQNVELALTLTGVGRAERHTRAREALNTVGLGDQLNKRPSQLSGGQMQRVAIARALVNDPDILLADEPTGALDSETGVQVMELLKQVASDRLVIMVTHNPELAEKYSTRIIRLLDGEILADSNPVSVRETVQERERDVQLLIDSPRRLKKPGMSFNTSFGLSLRNLFTKKGRTLLTSFAGSIGIIGIALILSISDGLNSYIDSVEEETLSSYPLTIESTTMDIGSVLSAFMGEGEGHDKEDNTSETAEPDRVYENSSLYLMMNAMANLEYTENDLESFKAWLDAEAADENSDLHDALSGIMYTYDADFLVYTENVDGDLLRSDLTRLMQELMMSSMGLSTSAAAELTSFTDNSVYASYATSSVNLFAELLPGLDGACVNDVLYDQYDLLYGRWPEAYDEVILVLDENNELDDITLYALGLIPQEQVSAITDAALNQTEVENPEQSWTYEEICDTELRLILNADCYSLNPETGVWEDLRETDTGLRYLYDGALPLKITGVVRPDTSTGSAMFSAAVGYTYRLTEYLIEQNAASDALAAQQEDDTTDIFTGLTFRSVADEYTDEEKAARMDERLTTMTDEEKAALYVQRMSTISDAELDTQTAAAMAGMDRATIEASVSGEYAASLNLSAEELSAYMQSMDDETLFAMVEQSVREQIAAQYAEGVAAQLASVPQEQLCALFDADYTAMTVIDKAALYMDLTDFSDTTVEDNLALLGLLDLDSPASINLYASSFESKDAIVDAIARYNEELDPLEQIEYTDYIGLLMSSITSILNAITYILIAFVGISLIVSSIMIGVITLISVQERTKEIGILRSIGASKRNVSSLFNAETLIIGFTSGLLGVVVTELLLIPINALIHRLTNLNYLSAFLRPGAAVILVLISMLLTLLAGIIPSRSASRKDPVVALRTE